MTAEDIRICFVGDSFVNGTGDETALGWVGRVCALAHTHGFPITSYNLGIRRNTSADILQRWESECFLRLPAGCDNRVVLSCGVNDSMIENGALRVAPQHSRANVRAILRAASQYKLLMVGPPPMLEEAENQRIGALSRAFAEEAAALGVPFIELFSALVADAAYKQEVAGNDGAHPRSGGYTKIANIVASSPHWWFHSYQGREP